MRYLAIKNCIFTAVLLASWSADAFHLNDHLNITALAIAQFNRCYGGILTDADQKLIVASNLEEDLNLLRKEFFFSHFFSPLQKLKMFRGDSMDRMKGLAKEISANGRENLFLREKILVDLGHAIHHIQDMTVPSHVIPVGHGTDDGFEVYPLTVRTYAPMNCFEMAKLGQTDLEKLLFETAGGTIATIRSLQVPVEIKDAVGTTPFEVNGDAFWLTSGTNRFGRYGYLGNHFGAASIPVKKALVIFQKDFYQNFKSAQIQIAIRNTVRAMYWALVKKHGAVFLQGTQLVDSLIEPALPKTW